MTYPLVTVKGLYKLQDGIAANSGSVLWFPTSPIVDTVNHVTISPVNAPIQLDATGLFTVQLLPMDTAGINTGWAWAFRPNIPGVPGNIQYVVVDLVNGTTQWIDQLATAEPSAGFAQYATLTALGGETTRAEAAELSAQTVANAAFPQSQSHAYVNATGTTFWKLNQSGGTHAYGPYGIAFTDETYVGVAASNMCFGYNPGNLDNTDSAAMYWKIFTYAGDTLATEWLFNWTPPTGVGGSSVNWLYVLGSRTNGGLNMNMQSGGVSTDQILFSSKYLQDQGSTTNGKYLTLGAAVGSIFATSLIVGETRAGITGTQFTVQGPTGDGLGTNVTLAWKANTSGIVIENFQAGAVGLWSIQSSLANMTWFDFQNAARVHFRLTPGASSALASTTVNSQLIVDSSVVVGNAALATNATTGFLYVPSCPGVPTNTPATHTGTIPLAYDSTDNKLYVYNGGWKAITLS